MYKTKTKPHEVVLDAIDPARAIDSIVIPAHSETTIMSALLASSFVGRVAAFKATKVQVRVSMRSMRPRARAGVNRVARAVRGDGCVAAYRAPRAR